MQEKWARTAPLEPSAYVPFSWEKIQLWQREAQYLHWKKLKISELRRHDGAALSADYTCCRGETQEASVSGFWVLS